MRGSRIRGKFSPELRQAKTDRGWNRSGGSGLKQKGILVALLGQARTDIAALKLGRRPSPAPTTLVFLESLRVHQTVVIILIIAPVDLPVDAKE